jgi:GT2 family glycosyltransferase
MDISFVILTWNSEPYIEACLRSIHACLEDAALSYEIFVVDNGSADRTPVMLRSHAEQDPKHLKPIYLAENRGTTVSRNLALRKAAGRYLCVMDSDVELLPGLFKPLIEVLEAEPSSGMVVPRINYPSGRWQKSFDCFPTLAHKIRRLLWLREIENREARLEQDQAQARTVDYAISAFWLCKRQVVEKIGLLDEKIFYSPEDVDYCLRVWQAGYKIQYVPTVTVIHHAQEISRGFRLNRAKLSHLAGLFYLFCKHGYFWRRPVFPGGSL